MEKKRVSKLMVITSMAGSAFCLVSMVYFLVQWMDTKKDADLINVVFCLGGGSVLATVAYVIAYIDTRD